MQGPFSLAWRGVNLIEHAAVAAKTPLGFVPILRNSGDRKQLNWQQRGAMSCQHLGTRGPIKMAGNNLLARLRVKELQISLRGSSRPLASDIGIDDGNMWLRFYT